MWLSGTYTYSKTVNLNEWNSVSLDFSEVAVETFFNNAKHSTGATHTGKLLAFSWKDNGVLDQAGVTVYVSEIRVVPTQA